MPKQWTAQDREEDKREEDELIGMLLSLAVHKATAGCEGTFADEWCKSAQTGTLTIAVYRAPNISGWRTVQLCDKHYQKWLRDNAGHVHVERMEVL